MAKGVGPAVFRRLGVFDIGVLCHGAPTCHRQWGKHVDGLHCKWTLDSGALLFTLQIKPSREAKLTEQVQ